MLNIHQKSTGVFRQNIGSGYECNENKRICDCGYDHDYDMWDAQKTPQAYKIAEHAGLFPTPKARDYKDTFKSQEKLNNQYKKRMGPSIALTVGYKTGSTSQLNPRFVAEMMGFPPDWTELPFQSGETKALKAMEMP